MQSEQPKYRIGMTVSACLWLGLFPLLQGGTYARITHDKWIITLILTAVSLACFLADMLIPLIRKRLHKGIRTTKPVLPGGSVPVLLAGLLLLWTVLSCLLSSYGPDTWWLGKSARYEGLATQLCYLALFFGFFFSRVRLKPVLFSAAAGVTAFFVVVMLQRGGGNPLGLYPAGRYYDPRSPEFQGTIGNIDIDTGYLLLMAGLFLYGLITFITEYRARKKPTAGSPLQKPGTRGTLPAAAILLIALGFTLYLIITMDVQFGMISLAVLFLFTFLRFLPKKLRLPVLMILILIALLVVWFWPGHAGGIWELHEIIHGRGRLSFGSNRVAVWYYSLRLAGDDLLFGGGSGTFSSRFNQYLTDHNLSIPKEQDGQPLPDYFDNPHNHYVQQLTDHGLPAMLLFLTLLLFAVFRRRDRFLPLLAPCSAAVLCYAVQAFFCFSVCLVAPMFWVILGLSFGEK